jgi:hypothetical protein
LVYKTDLNASKEPSITAVIKLLKSSGDPIFIDFFTSAIIQVLYSRPQALWDIRSGGCRAFLP